MARVTTALLTAGLLIATACSGDDNGDTNTDTGDGNGSEASGETNGDAEAFCDEVRELGENLLGGSGEQPSDEQGRELVETLRQVDAPAEIEDDWNLMLDAMEQGFASGADPSQDNPELQTALANLGQYSQENCSG